MNVIELPEFLPYRLIDNSDQLLNKICYIYKACPNKGVTLLIYRSDGVVCFRLADLNGKIIDPSKSESDPFISKIMDTARSLMYAMRCIRLDKALFYFSNNKGNPVLLDVRLSLDKFLSPGFIEDFIGKQKINIQERIGEPITMTSELLEQIRKGANNFKGNLVIKPSVFKPIIKDDQVFPLYGVILREIK